jgi:hypothetical protein
LVRINFFIRKKIFHHHFKIIITIKIKSTKVTQQEASDSNAQQIKSMVERSNGIDSSHVSSATLQGQVTFFILLFKKTVACESVCEIVKLSRFESIYYY